MSAELVSLVIAAGIAGVAGLFAVLGFLGAQQLKNTFTLRRAWPSSSSWFTKASGRYRHPRQMLVS
jgi:hypothetical protein